MHLEISSYHLPKSSYELLKLFLQYLPMQMYMYMHAQVHVVSQVE